MNGTTGHDGTTGHPDTPHGATAARTPGDSAVVVVGAGPTGLLLAGDLAAAGIPVTLVEKRPHGISNLSRAMVVHARTLEQLDTRGLADELEAKGRPLGTLRLFGRLALDLGRLPTRFPHVLVLAQYEVERVLERRAVAAGVRFAYGTEVAGLAQDADGVTLALRGPDGAPGTLRAAYAVGADGLRSGVREAVGLPFPGCSVIRSLVLADVRLAEPPPGLLTVDAVGDAFAFIAPFADGYHRVIGWNRSRDVPDGEPLGLDEVKEIVRAALGRDFGMHDARWMSRFHSDERQAPAYRVGRVLLAGDAAHVHSPAGGQGMNTGLQDAANLSWKLAAAVRGRAPQGLLDTYQAERHPVGRAVLRSSGGLVRLAMAKRPWTRAARAAVGAVAARVPAVRARAAGQVTGIGIAYPSPKGAHPLVGRRVPDVATAEGRLYELLRTGGFVLVSPRDEKHPVPGGVTSAHWSSDRRTTLLVRPDGYVGWAARDADAGSVRAALGDWGLA
ncbi:FAD-dependent monooxygenase [Streptomyces sp. NPDC002564]|uniref:FAD-dependent monooxygenase n=1 Tax=Streptomyces sp. NPDC002564 TaxID=3364649 RepID=UPI0036BB7CC5